MKHSLPFSKLFASIGLVISGLQLNAQKDTSFWFVAPEITKGNYNYDSPVVFRISTYDAPSVVTISMPANPSFPVQTVSIPTGSSEIVDLTVYVEAIENKPPDQKLNKGILIESTDFITVYYEVIGQYQSNPEIYALKGQNALGKEFFIPLQNIIENSNAYSPLPHSAFDIVSTENNNAITITPTRALVGHPANTPFTILLDRGETYNAEALSQSASEHPTGSHVTSDKPIAITIKDDLLESGLFFGGTCRDQIGDQIIPVEQTGRRYVVQKGLLDGEERIIVVGTAPGTSILKNGIPVATINTGQSTVINIDLGSYFIEASNPVYVHQVSGNGCEVAGEIIPSLDCSGSRSVRFVRTNNEDFVLFVVTAMGNQDAFTVNGNSSILSGPFFQPVPGSNNEFVAAAAYLPENEIIPEISTEVANSKGKFHLGFINGASSATGCRFGFFSDFLNKIVSKDTVYFCIGDTITSHGIPIWTPGTYSSTLSHGAPEDCDTLIYITALSNGKIFNTQTVSFCQGASVIINGVEYFEPGILIDTIPSITQGCDTILTLFLQWNDLFPVQKELFFCPGSSIIYNGMNYSNPGIILDTIPSISNTCDTLLTISLKWNTPPSIQQIQSICKGDTLNIGNLQITSPFTIIDTLNATTGCDTVRTTKIQWMDLPQITQEIRICPGDSVRIGNQFYHTEGQILDTLHYPEICDTLRIISIVFNSNTNINLLPDIAIFCPGEPLTFESPYPFTVWNKNISTPIYTVAATGLLTVYFRDNDGCPHQDTVDIKSCCGTKTIYVPNTFAIDSDPPNHIFKAYSVAPCAIYSMRIYDRWGELLFTTDNPNQGWDGYFRGKACATGVYVWVLEVAQEGQERKEVLKGDVTLLR